jgi:hypothetical protein
LLLAGFGLMLLLLSWYGITNVWTIQKMFIFLSSFGFFLLFCMKDMGKRSKNYCGKLYLILVFIFFPICARGGTVYLERNGRGLDSIQFKWVYWPYWAAVADKVIENNIYISFPKHFFLKLIFHVYLRLFFFFFPHFYRHLGWFSSSLLWSLIFFSSLSIPTFRCTIRFLLRSQLSFPYRFSRCSMVLFHVHFRSLILTFLTFPQYVVDG